MPSVSQIKFTRVPPSGLVRKSTNLCHICFATTIFYSSFLRTIWQSTSTYLVLSWNMAFFGMCIVALLSPYSLMGHSGGKPNSN